MPKRLVTLIGLLAPLGSLVLVLNAAGATMITAAAKSCSGCGPASVALPYIESLGRPWINVGGLHVDFSFVLDQLSLVMLLVVTGVGFLIHIYSVGYMADEDGYARFFSYLNLFLFFMTILVLAGNVLLMFVGWEGVGLASYLLVGFYFSKTSAANAGKKAFVVNRVGDFGFLIGIFSAPRQLWHPYVLRDCRKVHGVALQHCLLERKTRHSSKSDASRHRNHHPHLPLSVDRRRRQERAASALRLAS